MVFGSEAYRDAAALFDTQVHTAVQVDLTRTCRELKHVEGEQVGGSHSVCLHHHRGVSRVGTAAHKQETLASVIRSEGHEAH